MENGIFFVATELRINRAGGRLAKAEGRRPDASAGRPCRPGRTLLAKSGAGSGSGGTGRGHPATEANFLPRDVF